jgi:uncharacterized protein (DUF305 family)
MENKNNVAMYSIVFLVVGIFVGWLIWANSNRVSPVNYSNQGLHMMPNGSMMGGNFTDMDDMMDYMKYSLQGKSGDSFDKEFLSQMIVHHQGAVDMAKAVLQTSKRPELVNLANDIISAQTKEINMMQNWQKDWFK